MKASIAIPMYDVEPHSDECIRSALDPTHSDIKVIAVDDGPADSSPKMLKGHADHTRVLGTPSGGTAPALNHGCCQMQGSRSKRPGADDLPQPHAVKALLGVHYTSLGPASDLRTFCADCDSIDGQGRPAPVLLGREYDCSGLSQFERNVILPDRPCGSRTAGMPRRAVLSRCGPSGGAPGLDEDYEFWLRCRPLHGYTMRFVPGVLARRRAPAASQTASPRGHGLRCGAGMRRTRTAVACAPRRPSCPLLPAAAGGGWMRPQHRRTRRRPA